MQKLQHVNRLTNIRTAPVERIPPVDVYRANLPSIAVGQCAQRHTMIMTERISDPDLHYYSVGDSAERRMRFITQSCARTRVAVISQPASEGRKTWPRYPARPRRTFACSIIQCKLPVPFTRLIVGLHAKRTQTRALPSRYDRCDFLKLISAALCVRSKSSDDSSLQCAARLNIRCWQAWASRCYLWPSVCDVLAHDFI